MGTSRKALVKKLIRLRGQSKSLRTSDGEQMPEKGRARWGERAAAVTLFQETKEEDKPLCQGRHARETGFWVFSELKGQGRGGGDGNASLRP